MALLMIRSRIESSGYSNTEESGMPTWANTSGGSPNDWWYRDGNGPNGPWGFFWSLVGNQYYLQYGRNYPGWASVRMIQESITWTNEHQNDDGSVSCDVTVDLSNMKSGRTQYAKGGIPSIVRLWVGNDQVFEHAGSSTDIYNQAPSVPRVTRHITVPPQGYSDEIQLWYGTDYPQGQYPNARFRCGGTLYNPSLPSYIPMASRKGGGWQSLNDHNGHILVRHGGWQDKSKENFSTQRQPNQGHNRIRRSGQWLQLPKM